MLQTAAIGAALMLPSTVRAARFHRIEGEVSINGKPADGRAEIHALDLVVTGANGGAILIMGKDALLIRANSEVEILGKPKTVVLTGLRMLTGALLAVFGKGERQLLTATATAGIRGTGVYMESSPELTYFCTCYGEVELVDQHRLEKRLVVSGYHTPNYVHATMRDGAMMHKADFINHTDEELVMLEGLVGRKPPFAK
jgi:hypothetical protein